MDGWMVFLVDRPVSGRQSSSIISYQQHYDDADNTTSGQFPISRRSPRRCAAVDADDPSCRRSPPPPPQQMPVDRRPSPLHLVASDASRRSPRDNVSAAAGSGRGGAAPPPISPRDAAAIAAGADRRTTFATQKSFSYDVPRVEPPAQVHYRKQSEPTVGSGQRYRQPVGGGRLLPRLPISRTQLEHHISQLLKYRGGTAAMNLSVDTSGGPQQLNAEFVAELKEHRRQISPSHKAAIKDAATAAPVGHPAAASRWSPGGLDSSLVSEPPSDGRRRTFAGQKSLSYEVNQFVQYQPSGSGAERLRDYLDENEIKEFEIEDADGTGVSVWVPPATLGDREDGTYASRLNVPTAAARRATRVSDRRRAHFAEQRSFSCEAAASSAPVATGYRGSSGPDTVGRRYARETNVRLVRQPKTEALDAVDISTTSARDGAPSREKPTTADTEVYRPHHHQTSDSSVEQAGGRGYGEFDPRGTVVLATGNSGGRYSTDRNRKSAKEKLPLERHSSMASGVEERDVDEAAVSSGRRHTTGQVPDHRHQDTGIVDARATTELKHYSRVPVDTSYPAERGRVLMTEVDTGTGDMVVEVGRKTSPRRVNVDAGKDTERVRPSTTQLGGHAASLAASYQCRRTNDFHDKAR